MAYIDYEFYKQCKCREIVESDFLRLADAASDVIYDVCRVKPNEEDVASYDFRRAVAYQTELLFEQGGIDALVGFSAASASDGESLGDYSISGGSGSSKSSNQLPTVQSIPVSPQSMAILRKMNLMARWAYARR